MKPDCQDIKSNFPFQATLFLEVPLGNTYNLTLTKQLDLGFEIRYFSDKDSPLRNANSEMLKDPSKLIEGFIKFIKETKHLFPNHG